MATSNKAFPIILIGVAALGILAYFGMNNPPGDEVTGTVAPAERYRAEQDNEIQLGDESIQEVLQSDVFERLVSDEAFRRGTQDEQVRALMLSFAGGAAFNSDALRTTLEADQLRGGLADENFRGLFLSADFWAAMKSDAFKGAVGDLQFRNLLASSAFSDAFKVNAFKAAFDDSNFRQQFFSENFRVQMAENLRNGVSAEALQALFMGDNFKGVAGARMDDLMRSLGDERLLSAFRQDEFRKGVTAEALKGAMSAEAFRGMLSGSNFDAFKSLAFRDVFGSEDLRGRLSDLNMIAMFEDSNLRGALGNDAFRQMAFSSEAFKGAFSQQGFADAWRSSEALRSSAFEAALRGTTSRNLD